MSGSTFADLKFEAHRVGEFGVQAKHGFENGYSVSVISGLRSYGGDRGLYELAVMHGGELIYDTPITKDVLGHLSEADVTDVMIAVAGLPPRVPA